MNVPSEQSAGANSSAARRLLPRIKIYGERNTGTNYLSELLRLNFQIRELRGFVPWPVMGLQLLLPGKEAIRDAWFSATFGRNLGWKHMKVESPDVLKNYAIVSQRLSFLTLTKNPYAWLLSMHRRPYHQSYRQQPDFEEFLQLPWRTTGRDNTSRVVENPIQLWNLKNRSYLELRNRLPVLNVRYEDLLDDPIRMLHQIADAFALPVPASGFRNFEQSTKDSDRDAAWYRDYYLNERWRCKLSATAIQIINEQLDHDLMTSFHYNLLATDQT
ncbi:MAG: hypothetical protein R3C49_22520 [Planctomycetaceae bacterium]